MKFIENIGLVFINSFSYLGKFILFIIFFFKYLFNPKFYFKNNLSYFINIFVSSIPIIALTGIFSGMVLALQSYTGFSRFSAESAIPNIVVLTLTRELGPVLTGLMISARVGSSIAAEIATMRVTEQIDALGTLGTRPMQYLIAPKIIASLICIPLLVLIGNTIGILGGYVIAIYKLNFNPSLYLNATMEYLQLIDIIQGTVKAAVFGLIISMVSCYFGYNASKGAEGGGFATTSSVVISSVMILTSTYIITALFFG